MNIDSEVFQVFYPILRDTVINLEFDGVKPDKLRVRNSKELWNHLTEERYAELFGGGGTGDREYFWRKRVELDPKKNKMSGPIDDEAFIKALRYIGIQIPEEKRPGHAIPFSKEVILLYDQFRFLHLSGPTVVVENTNVEEANITTRQADDDKSEYRISEEVKQNYGTTYWELQLPENPYETELYAILHRKERTAVVEEITNYLISHKFWCYFREFCKQSTNRDSEHWHLDKALLEFKMTESLDLLCIITFVTQENVTLRNDHLQYKGKTDLNRSSVSSIVISLDPVHKYTIMPLILFIDIFSPISAKSKFQGAIGKYLIGRNGTESGFLFMRKVVENETDLIPATYQIPFLDKNKKYSDSIFDIHPFVLNFLADEAFLKNRVRRLWV